MPFVGQPVAAGVRETTLLLREYLTVLLLRDFPETLTLTTYETRLVLRRGESDLDERDTTSRLVRTL
jgi:hypothetical protein